MKERIKRAGGAAGLHVRRQAVGYVALAVALTGSAYAGSKAGSTKVGARDLRPVVERDFESLTMGPGGSASADVRCKRGEFALAPSASGSVQGDAASVLRGILPIVGNGRAKGYVVHGFNPSASPQQLEAAVVCLRK